MSSLSKNEVLTKIIDSQILPLYYHDDYERCERNIMACYDAGLKVFEFTNRGPEALKNFKRLKKELCSEYKDLTLGVGTVFSVESAMNFVESGADFIVQPICDGDVAQYCMAAGVLWIPGVMTLNEIYQASQLGAEIVKLFPAKVLGYDFIKAIRGPMPSIKIMVSGGIEATALDIWHWRSSGAEVCGLGSKLFAGDSKTITANIRNIMHEVAQYE